MSADKTRRKRLSHVNARDERALSMSDINSPIYERQSMKPWASGPANGSSPGASSLPGPGGITAPDVASIFAPVAAAPSLPTRPAPQSPLVGPARNLELEDELDSLAPKTASTDNSPRWKKHLPLAGLFVCGLVCGVVAMKFMAPKSLAPSSAVASSSPAEAPETAAPPADAARAKAPAKRATSTARPSPADSDDDEESRTAN